MNSPSHTLKAEAQAMCERFRRSADAVTLAKQHRAGFYEVPELVLQGVSSELRDAAALIQKLLAERERLMRLVERVVKGSALSDGGEI